MTLNKLLDVKNCIGKKTEGGGGGGEETTIIHNHKEIATYDHI